MAKLKTYTRRIVKTRPPKKLFVLAVEGKTEEHYFSILKMLFNCFAIEFARTKPANSPKLLLSQLKNYIQIHGIHRTDYEACVVHDIDNWDSKQIKELWEWEKKKTNNHVATSNPCFEYWLLLHFEESPKITDAKSCCNEIKKHIPNYDKSLPKNKLTKEAVLRAMERAEKRERNMANKYENSNEWLSFRGTTNVHKLVKLMIQDKETSRRT